MKILMVNKFLYPRGGVETYMLQLGEELSRRGHTVEYFGMRDEQNIVGNSYDIYADNMDFSNFRGKDFKNLFGVIYSNKNKKYIKNLLDRYNPDVVHLNNFNYQLSPSIIKGIDAYRKEQNDGTKIVYTAHDFSLICPAHSLVNKKKKNRECTECLKDGGWSCFSCKCVKNSFSKSALGMAEYRINDILRSYDAIDTIICPSFNTKTYIDERRGLRDKTVMLPHFVEARKVKAQKEDYYFLASSLTEEKGMRTIMEAVKALPDEKFVVAGEGPYSRQLEELPNVKLLGFINRSEVLRYMAAAKALIVASNWCETFGYVAAESIINETPVIASAIGALPEVVTDGVNGILFEPGNAASLIDGIKKMASCALYNTLVEGCRTTRFTSIGHYAEILEKECYNNER